MTHLDWIESNPLRLWRRSRNFSSCHVAKLLNVDTSTLLRWEYGNRNPDGENMQEIIFLTGITREQLNRWQQQRPQ